MFSVLNTRSAMGKTKARMCKILDSLCQYFRGFWLRLPLPRYPLESDRFRGGLGKRVGVRIALLVRQPALISIRHGKD
jgi:hypothetical protein